MKKKEMQKRIKKAKLERYESNDEIDLKEIQMV